MPTVYGSTSGSWWIYLNQSVYPFDNLSVRAAVAHAINYEQIIQQAFGGYATQWVGPVPPAYPYYNPENLTPYAYNLTLARAGDRGLAVRGRRLSGTVDQVRLPRHRDRLGRDGPVPGGRPRSDWPHHRPGADLARRSLRGAGADRERACTTATNDERWSVPDGPGVLHLRLHLTGRLDPERRRALRRARTCACRATTTRP